MRGSTWVNCLEDILIIHFFLSVILLALCVTLFLLINSFNFRICLFFVKSKDFLYKFSWIFSTRRNSSGVIDSKMLPFNCSMLFLSLSRISWYVSAYSAAVYQRAIKIFYFGQSWFYFLVVGLSVESCCDDSEEKIVND